MRKLQRELQKHDGPDHSVRDVRRPSWEDADKLEAEIMTPRDRLQRLLFEHRTAHDPASSEREILAMFEAWDQHHEERGPMNATYIEVQAGVRYWEDAIVNGQEDADGTRIPLRQGECWAPVIRLADGAVMDWPQGTTADVHFKVCDQGEYWLLDNGRKRVAKWGGHYVPDSFLCLGDAGYGDYIIFKVGADGKIEGWEQPEIETELWDACVA